MNDILLYLNDNFFNDVISGSVNSFSKLLFSRLICSTRLAKMPSSKNAWYWIHSSMVSGLFLSAILEQSNIMPVLSLPLFLSKHLTLVCALDNETMAIKNNMPNVKFIFDDPVTTDMYFTIISVKKKTNTTRDKFEK